MAFDIQAARKAGYTDDEIADFLGNQSKFDVAGARKAGYTAPEIVGFLSQAANDAVDRGPVTEGDPLTRVTPSTPSTSQATFSTADNTPRKGMLNVRDTSQESVLDKAAPQDASNVRTRRSDFEDRKPLPVLKEATKNDPALKRGQDLADLPLAARAVTKAYTGLSQSIGGAARAVGDFTGMDNVAQFGQGAAAAARATETGMGKNDTGAIEGFGPRSPLPELAGYLGDMAEGAGASIAQVAAMGGALGPGRILAGMFATSAGQKYDEARNAGLNPLDALQNAALTGAFEVAGEKYAKLDKVVSSIGQLINKGASAQAKRNAGETLISAGVREIPSEMATYLGQSATDLLPGIGINQDMTMGEFLDGMRDTVVQAGMMGGAMGAGGAIVNRNAAPAAQPIPSAEELAKRKGFLIQEATQEGLINIGAAQTVDDAIAAATQATAPQTKAVDNIARLLGETPDVSQPGNIPAVDSGSPGLGAPEPGIGVDTGVGVSGAAERTLDAGSAGNQPDGGTAPLGDGGATPALSPDIADTASRIRELEGSTPEPRRAQSPGEPASMWFGRRGDGYQTPEDASAALPSRQRVSPDLEWKVEQMPSGRYRLAGYDTQTQQPASFKVTLNPTGTATIIGNPDAIKAKLAEAGIDKVMSGADRVIVGTSQAQAAVQVLQTNQPQALANTAQPAINSVANDQNQPTREDGQAQAQRGEAPAPAGSDAPGTAAVPAAAGPAAVEGAGVEPAKAPTNRTAYVAEVRRQLGDLQPGDVLENDMGDKWTVDVVMRNKAGEVTGFLPREGNPETGEREVLDLDTAGSVLLPTPYLDASGNRKLSQPGKVNRAQPATPAEPPATESQAPAPARGDATGTAAKPAAAGPATVEGGGVEPTDYLAELFGSQEQRDAAQAKYVADQDNRKAAVQRIRDEIARQKERATAEYADWSGRKYKANKTQVDLQGDGPSNQASMSIGAINEGRRRNAMDALAKELTELDKLAAAAETESGAEKILANLTTLRAKAAEAVKSGNWPGSTEDSMFESMLLDALKFRGPAGKGNVTSNGLSKAMLAAINGAPTNPPTQAQAGTLAEGAGESRPAPVAAPEPTAEQKIRQVFDAAPRTIGSWHKLTVEHNGKTQEFLANMKRVNTSGKRDSAIHLVNIRPGRLMAGDPLQDLAYYYKLDGKNNLVEEGIPSIATPEQLKAFGRPDPRLIPVSQRNVPKKQANLNTSAEPAQKTAESEQVEANDQTPKQYHDARLRKMSDDTGTPLAEVREFYDTEGGRAESDRLWSVMVDKRARDGATLTRQTLDKFYELNPTARLPETAFPNGYQRPDARKQEAVAKDAIRQDRREARAARAASEEQVGPYGRDLTPIAQGGKPFKSLEEAREYRKKNTNNMVVKKVGKNQYVLQEASAKQIAAWDKAGKRLGIPQTGGEGPQHVHGFLIGKGGLNKKLMADAGFDRNHRIGNRTLFAGTGGMTAERATELLAEAGYLKAGASHSDMFALVRKSVQTPQYTSDGWEQLAQAEQATRFEDHLAVEQEATPEADDFDALFPRGDDAYTPEEIALVPKSVREEYAALTEAAEAAGVDVDAILEDGGARISENQTQEQFNEYVRQALTDAIADSRREADRRESAVQGREDAERGGTEGSRQDAGGSGAQEEGLTAPTPAQVLEQQDRADRAEELDQREQIQREAEGFQLQAQAPEQRSDNTGDMLGGPSAEDVMRARKPGKRQEDDGTEPMFSRTPAWRSDLRDKVAAIKMESSKEEGWRAYISGLATKGVKPDEIEWSGVTDWLKLQTGKVTKQQILDYLDGNGVQVQEVVKGEMPEDGWRDEAGDLIRDGSLGTKYSQYTLPGGENYREVLLTLPEKTSADPARAEYEAWAQRNGLTPNATMAEQRYERETGKVAPAPRTMSAMQADAAKNYKSSHWDTPNVLAHIRLNDRTDADGKRVLFVEEVQSDWGQQGKKKGFAPKPGELPVGWKRVETAAGPRLEDPEGNWHGVDESVTFGVTASGRVPVAPFVTSTDKWLSLALKRIITMAAQEGYDRVAFVNGEQSAERYDLSKQVDYIDYRKRGDDSYDVAVVATDGRTEVFSENGIGLSRIEDVVGKEVAQKIADGVGQKGRGSDVVTLRGLDLKVGGEGMKAFYDKILPNTLKDVLKKVGGGKVEMVNVGTGVNTDDTEIRWTEDSDGIQTVEWDGGERKFDTEDEARAFRDSLIAARSEQPGFTITPAMIEKASQGLPLFDKQGGQSKPTGLTPTQFTIELSKAFGAKVAERLQAKGVVVPLADQSKLPAHVVPFLRDGDIIYGFYDPKTDRTYAVLENLTPEMVKGLVLHEVGVHFGFEAMLGEAKYTSVMNRLDFMRRAGNKAVKEAYAEAQKNSVRDSQVPEETLAYLVQSSPEMGIIKEIIARIKAFLFSEFGIGDKYLTEADLTMLARAAVDHSSRMEDGGSVVPTFSRGTNEAMTNKDVVGNTQGGRSADDYQPGTVKFNSFDNDDRARDRLSRIQDVEEEYRLPNIHQAVPKDYVPKEASQKTVTIYRGVPTSVKDASIRPGDWVGLSKKYAADHGTGETGRSKVISIDVPADHVVWAGTDMNEWFYAPRQPNESPAPTNDGAFSRSKDQTNTPEFKAWFGDSVVTDTGKAGGRPLRVYHGTYRDFSAFDEQAPSSHIPLPGFYFTPDPDIASMFAESGAKMAENKAGRPYEPIGATVMPVYLSLQNPLDFDASEGVMKGFVSEKIIKEIILEAKRKGHDGVVIRGWRDGSGPVQYVVFNPEQIKSVFNRGSYDPADPNIMFSRGTTAAPGREGWDMPTETRLDKTIYELQDGGIDLKRVQEAIKKTGADLEERFDARLAETLYPGRVAKRSENFLKTEVRPLLQAMALLKVDMTELGDYLIARHAPERNAQIAKINPDLPDGGAGRNSEGTLMTDDAAAEYLEAIPADKLRALETLAAKVDAITAGTRNLWVSEGLETPETVRAMEQAYKHYVPLFKDEAEFSHPQGMGFSVRGGASKRAMGSTKEVTNVLAHVLMAREAAITRAEKNRVGMALYGLALSYPNPDFWTVIRPNMSNTAIAAELNAMGVDPEMMGEGMSSAPTIRVIDPVTNTVVNRPNPAYKNMDNAVMLKVGGEDRVIVFNQRNERAMRMAGNLKNLDGLTKLELANSILGKATRYIAAVNTQYNPVFGLVNIIRDVQGATLNLTTTAIKDKKRQVLRDIPAALSGIARDLRGDANRSEWSDLWEQYQEDGGQTGYREMFRAADDRAKAIEKELGAMDRSTPGKAAHAVLDLMDDFNTALENAVRLSAYKAALDTGLSRKEAARLGKELTVNFNRKGRAGRELSPMYAFMNAAIQANARLFETLRGPAAGKIVAGGLMLGAAQALMLAAAGFDDDEIPEWVKARALIIPVDFSSKRYITIPIALGFNVIPNTGRVLTEIGLNGGKDAKAKAVSAIGEILGSLSPVGGGNIFTADGALKLIAPTVADPVIEIVANRNFAGAPIEREAMENDGRPGYQRARESTLRSASGQAYTGISRALNAMTMGTTWEAGAVSPSPEMIRYVARVFGGGLLGEIERVIDAGANIATGTETKSTRVPLTSRFYGEVDPAQVEQRRFFDAARKIQRIERSVKAAKKAGDDDEASRIEADNEIYQFAGQLDRVQSRLRKLNKQATETINNPAEIRDIDAARTDEMKALNDEVRAMEAERYGQTAGSRLRKVAAQP